jgi:hypothetical protein
MVLDLLGIRAVYARPYRPQTKGKIEKSFQFVQRDFLSEARFKVNSLNELNEAFAEWVRWYNHEHSHASLRGKPPAALYRTSERDSPLQIRSLCSVCHRRKVTREAIVRYRNRKCKVPAHLIGDHVWLRVTEDEFVVESQGFNVARHPLGEGHQAATA